MASQIEDAATGGYRVEVTRPDGLRWLGRITALRGEAAVMVTAHGHSVYLPHADRLAIKRI